MVVRRSCSASRRPGTTSAWASTGRRTSSSPLDSGSSWGRSSVGRAPAWHAGGHGFEPRRLHHSLMSNPSDEAARVLEPGGSLCLAVVEPLASAGQFAGDAADSAFSSSRLVPRDFQVQRLARPRRPRDQARQRASPDPVLRRRPRRCGPSRRAALRDRRSRRGHRPAAKPAPAAHSALPARSSGETAMSCRLRGRLVVVDM